MLVSELIYVLSAMPGDYKVLAISNMLGDMDEVKWVEAHADSMTVEITC